MESRTSTVSPKKYGSHKLCTKSHAKSSFNPFFLHHLENLKYWPIPHITH
ncbi:hypothetical protein B296_00006308 [Ensete ventricosum]|uniref:Uncharacterized protein n=1 Tax=Ensete ventricosum TaxID=4639 RepID=A0A426ZIG5_ENSVE|nr:hypothetical protein B296_00006308 [Ensete ventricosum]